jgi:NDP-sugar pyrophosphorylase family protein
MRRNLTIVIPMAGAGSRFANAGWNVPKPFISFLGKTMVEHVLDSFPANFRDINFVLIVRQEFLDNYSSVLQRIASRGNVHFVVAKKLTQGAACSVLLARNFFKKSELIVADSDTFYSDGVMLDFLDRTSDVNVRQAVITFNSDLPIYSYIVKDENGVRLAEKKVISNHALSGVYYFRNGSDFIDGCIDALIYGDRDKGEYYMSKIFSNVAQSDPVGVLIHDISNDSMFCTGTPEQLRSVINRIDR